MNTRSLVLAASLAVLVTATSASSAKAQFYTYGYNYGYAYNPYPAFNHWWGYNPYAFSNAYNPMTTSWPSMAMYNNFYNRNPRAGFGTYSNYYNPYTGGFANQYRYDYIR